MKKDHPGIFNNVLGPVMRGPSSSHTAASLRIGTIARQLLASEPVLAEFTFDPAGSLATTYLGQGSAMGLAAGLLGLSITDPSICDWEALCKNAGLEVKFSVKPYNASHPNTYKATIKGKDESDISFIALSTGGGAILFSEFNGNSVAFDGSGFEIIAQLLSPSGREQILDSLKTDADNNIIIRESGLFMHFHSSAPLADSSLLKKLSDSGNFARISSCGPVLPVIMTGSKDLPFNNINEFTDLISAKGGRMSDYASDYEAAVGKIDRENISRLSLEYLTVIQDSIKTGLMGTSWNDRILSSQSPLIEKAAKEGKLIPGDLINEIIASVSAIMETKSSMGLILAAPTAGSSGTIGGVLIPVGKLMGKSDDDLARALLASGLFGIFISDKTGFAAEEGGCQYECGAASGMAAVALTELAGGDALTAMKAGSMALQNTIGLVCDPVAGRVEVPCLGKNIMAALNALAAANMALAGFDPVIPAREVMEAMKSVGCSMPHELRCTGKGGLSVTPSAIRKSSDL